MSIFNELFGGKGEAVDPDAGIVLPDIADLKRITKGLATLDLVISPEWELRYYSYNSKWSDQEEMASMRNGSGDEWFLLFHEEGWAGLKGLDHEAAAARVKGYSTAIQAAVPEELKTFSEEPAFRWSGTTFCFWCLRDGSGWVSAKDKLAYDKTLGTGAADLLGFLTGGAEAYRAFAEEYYERHLDINVVSSVFNGEALTADLVKAMNPDIAIDDIRKGLSEIGYPLQ